MGNANRRTQQVNLTSPDLASDQAARLREIFPECITERKIDFDKLRATLGDDVDQRPERYSFSWAGKRDAIRILTSPVPSSFPPRPRRLARHVGAGHCCPPNPSSATTGFTPVQR